MLEPTNKNFPKLFGVSYFNGVIAITFGRQLCYFPEAAPYYQSRINITIYKTRIILRAPWLHLCLGKPSWIVWGKRQAEQGGLIREVITNPETGERHRLLIFNLRFVKGSGWTGWICPDGVTLQAVTLLADQSWSVYPKNTADADAVYTKNVEI